MPRRGQTRTRTAPGGAVVVEVFGRDGLWHVQNPPTQSRRQGRRQRRERLVPVSQSTVQRPGDFQANEIAELEREANLTSTSRLMNQTSNLANLTPGQKKAMRRRAQSANPVPINGSGMRLGSTDAGNAWADCILHPCMEPNPKPCGVPDRSSASVVCPLYKYSSNISIPSDVSSTTVWDLQVCFFPVPEIDYCYRGRPNSAAPWAPWHVVYAADFGQSADGSAETLEEQGYNLQRIMGRGHTLHLRASGTTNQGTVFAGQVSTLDWTRDYDVGATPNQGTAPCRYWQQRVPLDSSELIAMDPGVVEWEAWNGIYMPLRFTQNSFNYYEASPGNVVVFAGGVMPATWMQIVDSSQLAPGVVVLPNPPTFDIATNYPTERQRLIYGTSEPTPFLTGVVFFEGIDVAASVQVKSRIYMENQPEAATVGHASASRAIRPFAEPSPVYDPIALELAAVTAQVGPHAYPASANDLSTIFNSIWNGLKVAAKHVVGAADIASGLGLPFAGTVSAVGRALGL